MLEGQNTAPLKQKLKLHNVLIRPNIDIALLRQYLSDLKGELEPYDAESINLAEINMKYAGYIQKEQEMVNKMNRLESVKLRPDMDYAELQSLSSEAREKLSNMRPHTIGQASRISGVSPADISILLVHMGR